MTSPATALRVQRDNEPSGKPGGYRKTARIFAERPGASGEVRDLLFEGDVVGRALSSLVEFRHPDGRAAFTIKPHRKIMPMRWAVTSAEGDTIGVLKQSIFSRGFWSAATPDGRERFRIIDGQSRSDKIAMYLLDGVVSRYVFVVDDSLLGTVREDQREKTETGGVRGFFKALAGKSDPVLRFEDGVPVPDLRLLAMALFLLYEITVPLDRST